MTVSAAQVAVADTAVALNTETGAVAGTKLVVTNEAGTESAHLGAADVTTGTGYELANGETVTVELGFGEQLHAISTVTGTTVHVLRTGG